MYVIILKLCLLWEVSGNDLIPRCKKLYLWPLSVRRQSETITVNDSRGTNYRHKHKLLEKKKKKKKKKKKNRRQSTLTCSGLQLAKQLDSWEDIVRVILTEGVDSVSIWLLTFTCPEEVTQCGKGDSAGH